MAKKKVIQSSAAPKPVASYAQAIKAGKLLFCSGQIGIDLHFRSMEDFSPEAVAKQVKPLKELLDLRTKLADLRGTLQGNDKLEEILQATLGDEAKMAKLKEELGGQGGGAQ